VEFLYDKNNNIIQKCEVDCYNFSRYDNSPNPYKAINHRLKYPYFDKAIYLSDNNVMEYEDYIFGPGNKTFYRSYKYDSSGNVVLIDDKISIKY
jgi:hypothetical protein